MKATAVKRQVKGQDLANEIRACATPNGADDRLNCIATAAYYKAEILGFVPGRDIDNWLEAEAEFDIRRGG